MAGAGRDGLRNENGPHPDRDRAAGFQDRLRLTHSPLQVRTDGTAHATQAHGLISELRLVQHCWQYPGWEAFLSTNSQGRAAF